MVVHRLHVLCLVVGCFVLAFSASASADQNYDRKLERVFAKANPNIGINERDDERVNVDVAVLDTGIDLDDPDLDVVARTSCLGAVTPSADACAADDPADGDDTTHPYHGTWVASGIGGIDNDTSVVGVASGARLWAVDVVQDDAFAMLAEARENYHDNEAWTNPAYDMNALIAGVKWVTANADEIEVAALVVSCTTDPIPAEPYFICGSQQAAALDEAINESIAAGVVYVAPAGNWHRNVTPNIVPARNPNLITVSALADSDGQSGGLGGSAEVCEATNAPSSEEDDTNSDTSGWGAAIDIVAPGPCTSVAAPFVAGAAALLASQNHDVEDIREILVDEGNHTWVDESPDGINEPLLDVSDTEIFDPQTVPGTESSLGWDLDLKTRCVKTTGAPSDTNYYEDTEQCSPEGGSWWAYVQSPSIENPASCPGPDTRAFEINGPGSPVHMNWIPNQSSPLGPNWTVEIEVDHVSTNQECGPGNFTLAAIADTVSLGKTPLPHPTRLHTSHVLYHERWHPSSAASRIVAGAVFRWNGNEHHLEINLDDQDVGDTHPDSRVKLVHTSPEKELVVLDGEAWGIHAGAGGSAKFVYIPWYYLLQQALSEGWFSPRTGPARTETMFVGAQVVGNGVAHLWTTNFRIASTDIS